MNVKQWKIVQTKPITRTAKCFLANILPLDFPLSSESFLHGLVAIARSKQLFFRKVKDDSIVLFFLHYLAD